ncbi:MULTISPECIES: hypothetical protein [Streptomyces]|uniref:hypothetical protein n=1 Tax=Streptomyces TaxID=1883 RepID=UPI00240E2636|nr:MULTISPECIES: hypothetical protein [Streptomyces]WFB88477.1 hypothetical protein MMU79_37175 [Streptomyces olivaceus]WGK50920.1 hypothetical protein M6G09_37920 [Streptomyces sp. B146]
MIPTLLVGLVCLGAATGVRRRRVVRENRENMVMAHLERFPDQTLESISWSVGLDADVVIGLLERLRAARLAQCRPERGALLYRRAPCSPIRSRARSGT